MLVVVPPLLAFLFGAGLLWLTVHRLGGHVFSAGTWGRWDSGQYVSIVRDGYRAVPCKPGNVPPGVSPVGQLCGNVGWFPLYPLLMAGVAQLIGISIGAAGVLLSLLFYYLTLLLVWVLLRDVRPGVRIPCLLLAAVFPGQVYYHAIFPVSIFTFCTLAMVYLLGRRHAVLGGLAAVPAAGAAASYITGVLIAPALVGSALLASAIARRVDWRALGRSVVAAVGVLAGFLGVLYFMYLKVGIWGAYFDATRKYGVGFHNPVPIFLAKVDPGLERLFGISVQVQSVTLKPRPGGVQAAEQTLLVAAIVVLCVVATLVRRRVSRQDWLLIAMSVAFWIFPHLAGIGSSQYRSEALVVPVVLLARHLPAFVIGVLLAAATVMAWLLAPLFFNGSLQ